MNFQEAVNYLTGLSKFGINLGLSRMEHLLQVFGNPEKALKVIHVAGTNGKGSTIAMTANILKQAGYRVGVYISPHLYCFTERMSINGKNIPPERLAAAMIEALWQMAGTLLTEKTQWMSRYKANCLTLGKEIQVIRGDTVLFGKALDIDENGGLLVQYTDGTTQVVASGEVSVRGMYGYV